MLHGTLFLLHLSATLHTIYIEADTSCNITEKVCNGSPANITCYFSEYLNVTKQDFSVRKRGINVTSGYPDIPLDCYWPKEQPDTKCTVMSGYKYDYRIDRELVLEIPVTTAQHEGRYECQIVPMEWRHPDPCTLTLLDASAEECKHKNGESSGASSATVDIAVVVIVVIVAATICVLILILVRYKFLRRSCTSAEHVDPSQPNQEEAATPLEPINA